MQQASRNWYQKLTNALEMVGFKQSKADHSLFIFKNEGTFLAALTYMDDDILVGNNQEAMQNVKKYLDEMFSIKDLGQLKFFLGIEV